MPSTPIHDPITKRVSRYNRSRDPYLTLPYFGWSDDGPLLRELGRHLVDKRVERFVVATFHPDMIATRCHFRGKEKILEGRVEENKHGRFEEKSFDNGVYLHSRGTKFNGVLVNGCHPALTPAARCGGATTFALDIHRPITSLLSRPCDHRPTRYPLLTTLLSTRVSRD